MDVLTFETRSAVNSEIIKQVTSVGLSLFNCLFMLRQYLQMNFRDLFGLQWQK